MSILDTFLILFETDADKARREMKEVREEGEKTAQSMDKAVAHAKPLADGLGRANKAASGLGASLRTAAGVIGALGALAVVRGLSSALNETVEAADHLGDASARIRLSAQDFDTWRRAVKASGGEIEDAEAALASYDEMLRRIQAGIGKRGVEALAALGLTATTADGNLKDVRTSLLEVAGALEGMDRAQALRAIRRLGITDEGTISLLLQGRKAVEALSEAQLKNGAITNEQSDRINAYKDKTEQLSGVIQGWKFALVSAIIPALTTLNDVMMRGGQFIASHSDLVKGFGIAMGVAGGIIAAIYVPAMWSAAAATLAATWPIIAIGAAVLAVAAAFALAYEDVKAFLAGQPSMLGALIDTYPQLGLAIQVIALYIRQALDAFKAFFSGVSNGIGWISGLFDSLGQKVSSFVSLISQIPNVLGRIPGLNGLGAGLQALGGNVGGVRAGQQQLNAASRSPFASATSGSVRGGNRTTTNSVGAVTVNTRATDAAGTGNAVRQSLTSLFSQSHGELNDGVAR